MPGGCAHMRPLTHGVTRPTKKPRSNPHTHTDSQSSPFSSCRHRRRCHRRRRQFNSCSTTTGSPHTARPILTNTLLLLTLLLFALVMLALLLLALLMLALLLCWQLMLCWVMTPQAPTPRKEPNTRPHGQMHKQRQLQHNPSCCSCCCCYWGAYLRRARTPGAGKSLPLGSSVRRGRGDHAPTFILPKEAKSAQRRGHQRHIFFLEKEEDGTCQFV